MREEEGQTALCSIADAHAVEAATARSDRRAHSPSDPADAPTAAWNGTGQTLRPTGRTAGMPSDSSDGTDGSDGATSDRAVIMRLRRPRKNLTV